MTTPQVNFGTAIDVLSKLLEGKKPKQAAGELGISYSAVTEAKKKFPLFLGLPRAYKARGEE